MDFDGIDVETDDYKVKLPLVLGDGLFGVIDRGNSDGNFAGENYDEDADNNDGFQVGFLYGSRGSSHLVAESETLGGDLAIDTLTAGIGLIF